MNDRPLLLLRPIRSNVPATASVAEELVRTCPRCSRQLAERKCKLYCPDPVCGFYLSCADYY
jgi:hypothetical protein